MSIYLADTGQCLTFSLEVLAISVHWMQIRPSLASDGHGGHSTCYQWNQQCGTVTLNLATNAPHQAMLLFVACYRSTLVGWSVVTAEDRGGQIF
jgi:hypothetical protein